METVERLCKVHRKIIGAAHSQQHAWEKKEFQFSFCFSSNQADMKTKESV